MGDAADVLASLLRGGPPATLLGLPASPSPALTDLARAYRKRALLVHPDRCRHKDATRAFQLLSEAYDAAVAETGGEGAAGRWWQAGFDEWSQRMTEREERLAAEMKRFVANACAGYALASLQRHLSRAERISHELDEEVGIPEHALWPHKETAAYQAELVRLRAEFDVARLSGRGDFIGPAAEALHSLGQGQRLPAAAAQQRLEQLLAYLRGVHCYCIWCGVRYGGEADMLSQCPGPAESDHSPPPPPPQERQAGICEADPLDEYMKGVNEAAARDLQRMGKKRRRKP